MSSQLHSDDEVVYLVYVSNNGLPLSLIWFADGQIHEEYVDHHSKLRSTAVSEEFADPTLVMECVVPHYSYLTWLACAECGACSWLDYLCPECRDGR